MNSIERIAPDVGWLPISFVNAYFVGKPGGPWALIDSGLPGSADKIIAAAAARFGTSSRPEAILLTHGHFDHAGSARALVKKWDVPVYAHRLEMPYLTGRCPYPPPDPTIGGAIAFMSRFFPSRAPDLEDCARELPDGGEVPGLPDWQWHATPGHAPGHVSFFRPEDRTLLAGDAFATMDMDSWTSMITKNPELARAGSPFNYDWPATRKSVLHLASLRPSVAGCGHGFPMTDAELAMRLQSFANRFGPPMHGRYVHAAAVVDPMGVITVPRAPFDPVPFVTAGLALAAGIALGAGAFEESE